MSIIAYVLFDSKSSETKAYVPNKSRVLGVIDGTPGAGKTTICLFMGKVVRVVSKDVDDFTQPLCQPGHPAAVSQEGRDRRRRFLSKNLQTLEEIVQFLKTEINNYIETIPDGTYIVFCGLSNVNEVSIMPDYLHNVPQYLLKPSRATVAKRMALRTMEHLDLSNKGCMRIQTLYDDYFEFAKGIYLSMSVNVYKLSSEDGSVILRAVLSNASELSTDVIDNLVNEYNDQPTVDQRLQKLAAQHSCTLQLR